MTGQTSAPPRIVQRPKRSTRTFDLASLMLIVTLCCVASAIAAYETCCGLLFVFVASLALLLTERHVRKDLEAGHSCDVARKTILFLRSLLASLLLLLGSVAGAFSVCVLPLGVLLQLETEQPVAMCIGVSGGSLAAAFLFGLGFRALTALSPPGQQ